MDARYELSVGVPTVEEYLRLRVVAGMTAKSTAGAEAGLPNSWFSVVVRCEARVVGMGRIVSDGGTVYLVSDVAVEPAHQGRGLGKAIVGRLVEECWSRGHEGAYVSLFADGEAHRLYAQFGFEPTAPESIGMTFVIRR